MISRPANTTWRHYCDSKTIMMNFRNLFRFSRIVSVAVLLLLPAGLASAQPEPAKVPASVEAIFLAKDDGTGQVGEPAASFLTTEPRIYCIVQLTSAEAATVKMHFVAVSVPGVKPDTRVVTTSYTTKDGEDRVNFYGKPKTKWTAGKYRVEIFLNDKMVKDLPFDITGSAAVAGSQFVEPTSKPKPAGTPKKNKK